MDLCTWLLRRRFPTVQQMSTGQLAEAPGSAILLDVRPAAEYDLSHIPGARRVDMADLDGALAEVKAAEYRAGRPIVLYCSVGYRSSALAQKLGADPSLSASDVYNLHGSLFQWAIEDRAMVDADGQTATRVHPYNWVFGMLLPQQKRATLAPTS